MRIVVPYTRQYHPLARASHDQIPGLERIEVRGEGGYHELFADLWSKQEPFLLIEHDIEPTLADVEEMESCPNLWCTGPYVGPGDQHDLICRALGFTRFRKELMELAPNALSSIGMLNDSMDVLPGSWRRLDARLSGVLSQFAEVCIHERSVKHHHVYHGVCVCMDDHPPYKVDVEGRYLP